MPTSHRRQSFVKLTSTRFVAVNACMCEHPFNSPAAEEVDVDFHHSDDSPASVFALMAYLRMHTCFMRYEFSVMCVGSCWTHEEHECWVAQTEE